MTTLEPPYFFFRWMDSFEFLSFTRRVQVHRPYNVSPSNLGLVRPDRGSKRVVFYMSGEK